MDGAENVAALGALWGRKGFPVGVIPLLHCPDRVFQWQGAIVPARVTSCQILGFWAGWRAAGELEEEAAMGELAETPWRAASPSSSRTLAGARGKPHKNLRWAAPVYGLFPVLHLPWLSLRGDPNENQTSASEGISCAFVACSLTEAAIILAVKSRWNESGVADTAIWLQVGSEQQVKPADKDLDFRQICPALKNQGREDQKMTPTVDRRRVCKWIFD